MQNAISILQLSGAPRRSFLSSVYDLSIFCLESVEVIQLKAESLDHVMLIEVLCPCAYGRKTQIDARHKHAMSEFRAQVLKWVRQIPAGQVATYGQIAALAGKPRAPRQVGGILRALGDDSEVPWFRVINAQGGISTYRVGSGELQRHLLEAEGVCFNASGHCDLKRFRWQASGCAHP